MTQKQLGELVGIRNSVISFYELGERVPSPKVVKKLAAVLHVSTDYLFGVEKIETVDVSGLDENDKAIVRSLVESLRNKSKKTNKKRTILFLNIVPFCCFNI